MDCYHGRLSKEEASLLLRGKAIPRLLNRSVRFFLTPQNHLPDSTSPFFWGMKNNQKHQILKNPQKTNLLKRVSKKTKPKPLGL